MTFSNLQVPVVSLPAFAAVSFETLHPRYARLVLGLALAWGAATLAAAAVVHVLIIAPRTDPGAGTAVFVYLSMLVVVAFVAWFAHKAASVIGYALREHDVIVQSGVFWRRETVQPIRRIQHVEQHQGPLDRRFGLYTLKLFSAGTGNFTLRIPGLDAAAAARIRQFVLSVKQTGSLGTDDG